MMTSRGRTLRGACRGWDAAHAHLEDRLLLSGTDYRPPGTDNGVPTSQAVAVVLADVAVWQPQVPSGNGPTFAPGPAGGDD